jgi:outer membrane protein TolC
MLVSVAAALAAGLVVASPPTADTLRLEEAVRLARAANPMLRAERLRAVAAAERVPQAGAFPEPQLTLGLENRPVSGFGTEDMMTMNTVSVTQMLPWPGRRGSAREAARGRARADSLDGVEAEAMLVAGVKTAYAHLATIDRSLAVMQETGFLLRGLREVSAARYAVGETVQQDVLQAEVVAAGMAVDIAVMEQDRLAQAARLNALLGREAEIPIEALEPPAIGGPLPPVDSLMRLAVTYRPGLAAAEARRQSAAEEVRAAGRASLPDLMVGVEYGFRPRYGDMMSLMVGASIPLFRGSRQRPLEREMEAMKAMEEARALELRNETFARLAELRAEADRAQRMDVLFSTQVLPQAQAAVEAAQTAYRTGRADFMTLVESQMAVNRYAVERLRLRAVYRAAVSEIEALLGGVEVTP